MGEGRTRSQVGSGGGGCGEGEVWGSFWEERDGQSAIEDGIKCTAAWGPSRASPVQSAEVGDSSNAQQLSNPTAAAERPRERGLGWAGLGRTAAL